MISVDDEAIITGQNVEIQFGTANFGSLNLTANSAVIDEASATNLTGLAVANDLTLDSIGTVQGVPGANLSVGGTATIGADGQVEGVNLEGQFTGLDITGTTVELLLASDTRIDNIVSETLDVNAGNNALTLTDFGFEVERGVILRAGTVDISGATNSVGSLEILTTSTQDNPGVVEISSSIASDNDVSIAADVVRLGGANPVTISTLGNNGLGAITITDVDQAATNGSLFVNGVVTLDTQTGFGSPGANISVLASGGELGDIRTELDNTGGATSLTLTAGGGDVTVGNVSDGANLIDSFTVASANNINLNAVFVDGNTVEIRGDGNVNAQGVISDTTGAVEIFTTSGDITLAQDVTTADALSLTADGGSLTTASLAAASGLNINTLGDVALGEIVTVSSGDLSLASANGGVTSTNINVNGGNLSLSTAGEISIGGSTSSSGTVQLSTTSGSVTAADVITSGSDLSVAASAGVELNQVNVESGDASFVAGTGNLKFNESVDVASGGITAFSAEGGFEQNPGTLISAGTDIVISTEQGMKIASIAGDGNVTLAIRQTDVGPDGERPLFERVNEAIDFGSDSRDISSGGSISFLGQVASVGSTDPNQNFAQSARDGIYYGLVTGQFFSDDIANSQILVTAPSSASDAETILTNTESDFGDLAASLFGDDTFASLSTNAATALAGTDSASSNAGQTSASSSSRSTAASQQDDEDEVAEVDEAAFQNLRNFDENPQGILLPEDQQFAYDDSGNLYFMMAMRSSGGSVYSVPFYKVDLSSQVLADSAYQPLHRDLAGMPAWNWHDAYESGD